VLKEIKRVIRRKLIVITPSLHQDFWTPGHVTAYSKDKLVHVLKRAGFYINRCFYDKCFILKLPESNILVKIFNVMPFIWLRMNIMAVATKLKGQGIRIPELFH